MKTLFAGICFTLLLLFTSTISQAQWTGTGSNVTTGATKVVINDTKQPSATFWFGPSNTGPSTPGNYYIKAYDYWGPTVHFQATGDNGNELMNVTVDGKVGIGTTTPSAKIHSASTYTGGVSGGDYTDVANAQLKLESLSGYIRVPHISQNSSVSTVYNYQNGKDAYWGEPNDTGRYRFRGRNVIVENSNLGIATTNPQEKLQISNSYFFHDGGHKVIGFVTKPSGGVDMDASLYAAEIRFDAPNGSLSFGTASSLTGLPSTRLFIDKNGNTGIGTITPSNKLDVAGTIRAEEVTVEAAPWPDYVFSDTYELSGLSEVSDYIRENHHLPGIPTAEEVEENGIKLGDMNAKLLEKIEELTLYLIEQNKQLHSQNKKIEKQQNEIEILKSKVK